MKYMKRTEMQMINHTDNQNKIVIVGAGAGGLMAAVSAAQYGADVIVLEKNNRVGRKIMITGKGRCNLTNNCTIQAFIESVPSNGRFLYSAVNKFTPQDTMNFFESNGMPVKTERGNRVFPQSDKAVDVVDTLHNTIKKLGVKIIQENCKGLIIKDDKVIGVSCESGNKYYGDSIILACGGKSYPLTGSTGYGYILAKQAGHSIIEPKPSLVPLVSSDKFCKDLQGLSLKNVAVKVKDNSSNKIIYDDFGELLFTHFGLSGPTILSASAHLKNMTKDKYSVIIDMKPALSEEQLDNRLQRDFSENINKDFINSLSALLPRKMIPVIVELSGINAETKCNMITKQQRKNFVKLIKELKVNILGFRPIEEAIVTSGGVCVNEINPKTMESKIIKGLYFAGEMIDVDAYTGGFNLQIAFSTGNMAGESAALSFE